MLHESPGRGGRADPVASTHRGQVVAVDHSCVGPQDYRRFSAPARGLRQVSTATLMSAEAY